MTRLELQEFRRSKASMVFQRFALLPHRSVADNVAYGLHIQGIKGEEAEKRSQRWIERVGLTGYESHYTSQLSGGMQQRVGLARALATDAEILLMDEPFSALDPLIRTDMQEILLGLQTELQKTIIFITHDLDEALHLGNSIAILRDGEVIQIGTAQQIVMDPADDYIKDFIKDINRGRVIQVSSIMSTTVSNTGPQIEGDTVLEDALQAISNSGSGVGMVTKDGKAIGSVNLDTIISALSRQI
jgi:glycine betaine/proline transport system ATP-binding protein